MFDRLFLSHPRSIGESYGEHFRVAGGFGLTMIVGGIACLVHAVVPRWFERTGSDTVKRLNATMASRQPQCKASPAPEWTSPAWQPEYEI